MKKILAAVRPDDVRLVTEILRPEFELAFCHTLSEARNALTQPYDAIVCGLHFDDGNMFELLQFVKSDPKTRPIPFFCIKGTGSPLSPSIFKSIVIAVEKTGAESFVDVSDLAKTLGKENAYAVLKEALHTALTKGDAAPPIQ